MQFPSSFKPYQKGVLTPWLAQRRNAPSSSPLSFRSQSPSLCNRWSEKPSNQLRAAVTSSWKKLGQTQQEPKNEGLLLSKVFSYVGTALQVHLSGWSRYRNLIICEAWSGHVIYRQWVSVTQGEAQTVTRAWTTPLILLWTTIIVLLFVTVVTTNLYYKCFSQNYCYDFHCYNYS